MEDLEEGAMETGGTTSMRTAAAAALALALGTLVCAPPAAAQPEAGIEARCRAEVVELHRFLERWSNAELESSAEAFARFDGALDEAFALIGPDAEIAERAAVVAAIRGAWGRWREAPGSIRIENFRLWHRAAPLTVVTYEEWHDRTGGAGDSVGRLSTAVFTDAAGAPQGVRWLHLHEVWLPAADAD